MKSIEENLIPTGQKKGLVEICYSDGSKRHFKYHCPFPYAHPTAPVNHLARRSCLKKKKLLEDKPMEWEE